MSATLRSSRAKHQGTAAGDITSTITLGNPTGLTDDDYMLAILPMQFSTTGLSVTSVPSGWTLLYASGAVATGAAGVYGYFWVYGKKAASEPASRSWTLNNSVRRYNCQLIALDGTSINTTTPYEQLSSVSTPGAVSGDTITRTADTTASSETLVSVLMAVNVTTTTTSFTESAGTGQFEENFGVCDIAVNFLDVPSSAHRSVTGTATITGGGTAALAMTQLAFFPPAVNATVVSPIATATASRGLPSGGPGIGGVAARATAAGMVPTAITGDHVVLAAPGLAIASRVVPHTTSSRIALYLAPDVGGTIELVED